MEACPPSAAEERREQNVLMPSSLLERQNKGSEGKKKATYQRNVDQLNQPPTGHKSICQVFDGLDHADQLQGKKDRTKTLWVRLLLNIH